MASVIRIKRRMGEDPAEALLLSCKRLRRSSDEECESKLESVLSFAGTISSKSEPVSTHIKEAIKQRKLNKEILHHDFKHATPRPSLASRQRSQNAQASHNSRYRVLSGKRALDLAQLDKDLETEHTEHIESSTPLGEDVIQKSSRLSSISDDKENSSTDPSSNLVSHNPAHVQSQPPSLTKTDLLEKGGSASDHDDRKKEFCIFDVEQEVEKSDPFFGVSQQSSSGITVNNVPMVCRKAEPEPTDDSQFVYDLYYTHSSLADLDLQAALTVEALADHAFLSELGGGDGDGQLVHDESDDSNDEGNWRNDYPDEDPHFFENEDYDYAEDMVDTGYINNDDTDLLAYWMDSRCKMEARSDDDEEEYGSEGSNDLED